MNEKEKHPLHLEIGRKIIEKFSGRSELKMIRDPACGGSQHIPLFRDSKKKRETQYCNVDLLILKNGKVRVILEIEEADIKPTQICGKFLTSALSRCYIHDKDGGVVDMDASVLFIQFVDTSKLKDKSLKKDQFNMIEESIRAVLPLRDSKINTYRLLYDDVGKVIDAINQELAR
jgi:hypothetical protein